MPSPHVMGVLAHKARVAALLNHLIAALVTRALTHDDSKFDPAELDGFEAATPLLSASPYGSPAYYAAIASIRPAIDHHYAANPHHPEHFAEGVAGMTLIDVVEMVCDWVAAAERTAGGDARASLAINRERFGLEPQLAAILANTVALLSETPKDTKPPLSSE